MKKLSLLFLTVMLGMGAFAQPTTYSWLSEATSGNWNTVGNWWNGTNTTTIPPGGEILIFDNNVQTTMTNDLESTSRHQIFFTSNATQSRIITGTTENIFWDHSGNKPKIENNSSANQTIDFPLIWGSNPMELNPVSGDLTITSIINNDGKWTDVFGGNGKTLSIASMSGTGGLTIKNNNNNSTTVKITGTSSYTGNTYVDYGTLELQADVSSAEIFVKNGAKLVINGTDIDIQKLTIESGGTVEVLPGKQLTITGTAVNNGTIKLLSNGTDGTATLVGNVGGNAEVNQAVTNLPRTYYMASPINGTATVAGFTKYATFDEPTDSWSSTLSEITDNQFTATPGQGYLIQVPVGEPATTNISFTGALNTGDKTVGLTASNKKYNFLGNPYPSYLDGAQVVANTNVEKSIWYRSKTDASTYAFVTYNVPTETTIPAASAANNGFIPPMQGFWLKASSAGDFTFTNAMRTHNTTGTAIPLKAPQAAVNQILRVQVSNGTALDETVVLFNENATTGYDSYDASKMMNTGTGALNIYTIPGTENLVLNSMPAIAYDVEIPVGMKLAAGTYSVSIKEFSNFADGTIVLLIDKQTGAAIVLNNNNIYEFTITEAMDNADRFALVFPRFDIPTAAENGNAEQVYVFVRDNRIVVNAGENAKGTMIRVYNSVGQCINTQAVNGSVNEINGQFSPGVYLVKVNNVTAKVVMK